MQSLSDLMEQYRYLKLVQMKLLGTDTQTKGTRSWRNSHFSGCKISRSTYLIVFLCTHAKQRKRYGYNPLCWPSQLMKDMDIRIKGM